MIRSMSLSRAGRGEHATVFEAFNSIGKWSAEVLTATGSPQVVTLSTTEADREAATALRTWYRE